MRSQSISTRARMVAGAIAVAAVVASCGGAAQQPAPQTTAATQTAEAAVAPAGAADLRSLTVDVRRDPG
jgi:hypothetical protein